MLTAPHIVTHACLAAFNIISHIRRLELNHELRLDLFGDLSASTMNPPISDQTQFYWPAPGSAVKVHAPLKPRGSLSPDTTAFDAQHRMAQPDIPYTPPLVRPTAAPTEPYINNVIMPHQQIAMPDQTNCTTVPKTFTELQVPTNRDSHIHPPGCHQDIKTGAAPPEYPIILKDKSFEKRRIWDKRLVGELKKPLRFILKFTPGWATVIATILACMIGFTAALIGRIFTKSLEITKPTIIITTNKESVSIELRSSTSSQPTPNLTTEHHTTTGSGDCRTLGCTNNRRCETVNNVSECICRVGYEGFQCSDENECKTPASAELHCPNRACKNTHGSFYCHCNDPACTTMY